MKKVFYMFLFTIVLYSCKKAPFDYRNKFIGDYSFKVSHSGYYCVGGPDSIVNYDTISLYNGTVTYGAKNNTIKITPFENTTFEVVIYEDGSTNAINFGFRGLGINFESSEKVKVYNGNNYGCAGWNYYVIGNKK